MAEEAACRGVWRREDRARGERALHKGDTVRVQRKASTVLDAEERSGKVKRDEKQLEIRKVTGGFGAGLDWG